MNPYFQSNYGYNNMNNPYSYHTPTYPHTPIQQTVNTSIESMYTTVQPYNNTQFLMQTFGNKSDYIKMFLTLTHQDKLRMFMLMEEKKLYGQINDRDAYQRILKEIAQKMQNYNLFHQKKQERLQNSEQKKEKELESKINLICDVTFQKLNVPGLTEQEQTKDTKQEDDFGDFQKSGTSQTDGSIKSTSQHQTNQPAEVFIDKESSSIVNGTEEELNKQNIYTFSKAVANTPVIMNMFTFDSSIEKALTKQIGLKTASEYQKMSIWQLELDQTQIKSHQPNLSEIFKKKQTQKPNTPNSPNANNNKNTNTNQQQPSILDLYSDHKNIEGTVPVYLPTPNQNDQSNYNFNYAFNTAENNAYKQADSYASYHQHSNFDFVMNSSENQTFGSNLVSEASNQVYSVKEVPEQLQQLKQLKQGVNGFDQQEDEWNQAENEQTKGNNNPSNQMTQVPQIHQINHHPITSNYIDNFTQQNIQPHNQIQLQQQPYIIPQQQPYINHQQSHPTNFSYNPQPISSSSNTHQNLFDFDMLSAPNTYVQSHPASEINEDAVNFLFAVPKQKEQEMPVSIQCTTEEYSIPVQMIQTVVNIQAESNCMNSQLFLPQTSSKYEHLDKLKIEINTKDRQYLVKQLKNKSFQCDSSFYLLLIDHLRSLSLQNSTEMQHFSEQYKIVKEIHDLTELYSHAVDEDEEDKVQTTLRKSKQLYNQIYNKSHITQHYVQAIINPKTKQKGLLYKLAKILVDSCVNSQLLQRVISLDNNKNIQQAFYVLYVLQKLNSLSKLKSNTEKIMTYLCQQYQKYKQIDSQQLDQIEQNQQNYPKYIEYIKGLLKICAICQRMVQLIKCCCIKTQCNMVKTLKICKDLKIKYPQLTHHEQHKLIPNEYTTIIKEGVIKNISVYDMHSRFLQQFQRKPSCSLCLLEIAQNGEESDRGWCHYSCYNLISKLSQQSPI